MEKFVPRVKLADVARLAGVSASTVSRVLSNPEVVAVTTRQAVMNAVEATGYRLNHAARNLRKQRTGSVVALVPNLGNPFFSKILAGMGRELAQAGYDLLVADTMEGSAEQKSFRRFFDPSRADGIILLDGRVPADELAPQLGLPPMVCACEWVEGADLPCVRLDNEAGSRLAVEHLLSLGHRHIGLIGGPAGNVLHMARLAASKAAAGNARLTLFQGDFTLQSGLAAARSWIDMPRADRPSAIHAFSDEMACAFLSTVQQAGFRVPEDVSIVGFDDIELASFLTPALTTIHQPKRQIGRDAARLILRAIGGESVTPVTRLVPDLMIRGSTGIASDRIHGGRRGAKADR
ncbi:LacI family DNA-binding transcriptional regulator [Paracoccus sp. MBLB3053]|uniref:LacI family DNA-binding transcriptional regulator n=1 Tax=Paracoccus aurantius TaxID=3073814 RepID=A0ABU2HXL7_9RHOB|nr:LacI family DNA-binding transcriptional regulator [Paracoccus sp. MBLB3053]MDS9469295.1 LacI family DNA-binding transcriptional regulator [Paracoccus sp. MBLB3053]